MLAPNLKRPSHHADNEAPARPMNHRPSKSVTKLAEECSCTRSRPSLRFGRPVSGSIRYAQRFGVILRNPPRHQRGGILQFSAGIAVNVRRRKMKTAARLLLLGVLATAGSVSASVSSRAAAGPASVSARRQPLTPADLGGDAAKAAVAVTGGQATEGVRRFSAERSNVASAVYFSVCTSLYVSFLRNMCSPTPSLHPKMSGACSNVLGRTCPSWCAQPVHERPRKCHTCTCSFRLPR